MAKVFASGDKVFAKMRGYPAWPARVEGIADSSLTNRKYHVLFYGTLQRGVCRSHDIFPYSENKGKYGKSVKRKGFKEALNQIEGLAPVPQLVPKIVDEKFRNGNCTQKIEKTSLKGAINKCSDSLGNKRNVVRKLSGNKILGESDSNIQSKTTKESNKDCVKNYKSKLLQESQKNDNTVVQKRKEKIDNETDGMCFSSNINKVGKNPKFLLKPSQKQHKLDYSCNQSSEPNSQTPKHTNSQNDQQEDDSQQALPSTSSPDCQAKETSSNGSETVSRSGRIIKRKSFPDEVEDITPKRKRRVQNNQHRDQVNHEIEQQQSSPDADDALHNEDNFMTREPIEKRQTARKWLATENCMTRLDTLVRAQLGMTRANPEQCIRFLDDMCNLDLRPLMLKKHPEVVETIKRLRKYVGNASAWNFSDEQRKEFEEQAYQIRLRAECLFEKFKFMFSATDNLTFLEIFADSVIAFQELTQHWPLEKIYALVTEPKARRPPKTPKVQTKTKDS